MSENKELNTLYSVSVSEILSFKRQRWATANYGLLLYAAIISTTKLIEDPNRIEFLLLELINFAVFVVGLTVIRTLTDSIRDRDNRLVKIREMYSEEFRKAWSQALDAPDEIDKPIKLTWLFYSVFGLGFLLASWIIIRTWW